MVEDEGREVAGVEEEWVDHVGHHRPEKEFWPHENILIL